MSGVKDATIMNSCIIHENNSIASSMDLMIISLAASQLAIHQLFCSLISILMVICVHNRDLFMSMYFQIVAQCYLVTGVDCFTPS